MQGGLKFGSGADPVALLSEQKTEIGVGIGVIGQQGGCGVEMLGGFGGVSGFGEGDSEIILHARVGRSQLGGAAVVGDRLPGVIAQEKISKVVLGRVKRWIDADCFFIMAAGVGIVGEKAELHVCYHVVVGDGQGVIEERACILPILQLVNE
jgi:hypothetical protein